MKPLLTNLIFFCIIGAIIWLWKKGWYRWATDEMHRRDHMGAGTFWKVVLSLVAIAFLANCVYAISLKLQ
jgi:hypothetical protein